MGWKNGIRETGFTSSAVIGGQRPPRRMILKVNLDRRILCKADVAIGLVADMLHSLTSYGDRETEGLPARDERLPKFSPSSTFSEFLPTIYPDLYSHWLDISTVSIPNLVLASCWLNFCLQHHKVCTMFETKGTLPSRVIDISQQSQPKLTEGLDRTEPYVTLSYKWGATEKYTTTYQNLQEHSNAGLPLKKLPQTFREAIFVAHTLGFRWLWIDALCIVQDSQDEVIREMAEMDKIFQNSTLAIFATAGDDAGAGLGRNRDPRCLKPCRLKLATTLDDKTVEGWSYITLDGGEDSEALLHNRGWVLQEEVLAPRGLYFESRQMTWRCFCGICTEVDPLKSCKQVISKISEIGVPQYDDQCISYNSGWDGFGLLRMWIRDQDPLPDRTPWQRDNHFDHWYIMVRDYNQRALTYEADVMQALAGLSRAMARIHGCTYIAGLWKQDLQVGLLWYKTRDDAEALTFRYSTAKMDSLGLDNEEAPSVTKTDKLAMNAPSWSWMSQRGASIDFRGWENNHDVMEDEGMSVPKDWEDIVPQTVDIFTTMAPKSLLVSGRMRIARVEAILPLGTYFVGQDEEDRASVPFRTAWLRRIRDPVTNDKIGHVSFDEEPKAQASDLIYCLLVTARENYGKWQLTCLALHPTDQRSESFRRIGLVFMRDTTWFGEFWLYRQKDRR